MKEKKSSKNKARIVSFLLVIVVFVSTFAVNAFGRHQYHDPSGKPIENVFCENTVNVTHGSYLYSSISSGVHYPMQGGTTLTCNKTLHEYAHFAACTVCKYTGGSAYYCRQTHSQSICPTENVGNYCT